MAHNVRIKAKNSNGYTEIIPKSVLVSGGDRINGQVYGVYDYIIWMSDWTQNASHNVTFANEDALSTDSPYVVPMLSCAAEQIEWAKVSSVIMNDGSIVFHADDPPQTVLWVMVWWVR